MSGQKREHDTDGLTCWCGPRVEIPCPECYAQMDRTTCWRCDNTGWVETGDPLADGAVVIHNDVEICGP